MFFFLNSQKVIVVERPHLEVIPPARLQPRLKLHPEKTLIIIIITNTLRIQPQIANMAPLFVVVRKNTKRTPAPSITMYLPLHQWQQDQRGQSQFIQSPLKRRLLHMGRLMVVS
jgi:hypothetical protein